MAMTITGFWKSTTFYCKNHPEEKLELKQGPYSAYYGCKHEFDEENPCHNRLNLIDAEKILDHLMNEISSASLNGDITDLTNLKVVKNGIEYKVLYHNPLRHKISILVDNKKILMNK